MAQRLSESMVFMLEAVLTDRYPVGNENTLRALLKRRLVVFVASDPTLNTANKQLWGLTPEGERALSGSPLVSSETLSRLSGYRDSDLYPAVVQAIQKNDVKDGVWHLNAQRHNGAIQVDAASEMPLLVFLGGPIKYWWGFKNWDDGLPKTYFEWRDAVEVAFIEAGFLLYMPHHAWRGRWWESAQSVNDSAISMAHVLVHLTPEGVPADGTAEEIAIAQSLDIPTFRLPPGSDADLLAAVQALQGMYQEIRQASIRR